jgi:phage protein D
MGQPLSGNNLRQPGLSALVNGQPVAGLVTAEIQATSFLAADRFSLEAALSASDPAMWSATPLMVEITVSLAGQSAVLITGNADDLTIDPIAGTVKLTGRDLTSMFVDSQIDESFENQTSSEIVAALAARRGLTAMASPTLGLVGRYYQSGRTRTTLTQHAQATTEWDLICSLAQLENFDVWVDGSTLYFQPAGTGAATLGISPGDCMSLHMHHALDVAGGVTVTVKSWDSVSQSPVVQTASNAAIGQLAPRIVVRPNLSAADAKSLAERLVSQITGHERVLHIAMPGDLIAAPRMIMAMMGTGTDFDGQYRICSVERRLSFAHGFTQSIEARSLPWTAF